MLCRPGSIQTRQQIEIVQQFSHSLASLWQESTPSSPSLQHSRSVTFQQYLNNLEALLLYGYEDRDFKYISKVQAVRVMIQIQESSSRLLNFVAIFSVLVK